MRLLKKPSTTVETTQISTYHGSAHTVRTRLSDSTVEIVCPDKPVSCGENVWDILKHGTIIELEVGKRIDKIEFPDDNLILYGVRPTSMQRTGIWEGRVFECTIDYFEVFEKC